MSSNNNKRKPLLKSLLTTHLACSCGPSRPNHDVVHHPQPLPKPKPKPRPKSTSSSSNNGDTPSTLSPPSKAGVPESVLPPDDALSLFRGSVAVVKESEDPYDDFLQSMLQMIMENKILSTDDLHHLLRCFLRLNSPAHHHYILRAFFQVCDVVVSSSTPSEGA